MVLSSLILWNGLLGESSLCHEDDPSSENRNGLTPPPPSCTIPFLSPSFLVMLARPSSMRLQECESCTLCCPCHPGRCSPWGSWQILTAQQGSFIPGLLAAVAFCFIYHDTIALNFLKFFSPVSTEMIV